MLHFTLHSRRPPMHVDGRARGESKPAVTQLPLGTSASKTTAKATRISWGTAEGRNRHGHFTRAILCGNLQENAGPRFRGKQHFARACAVETHMDISQEPFCVDFFGKMLDPDSGASSILREPAQSKRTRTFHNSHFVWKFIGKMPHAPATTSIKHQALTLTVRTPSVWPHSLGNNKK